MASGEVTTGWITIRVRGLLRAIEVLRPDDNAATGRGRAASRGQGRGLVVRRGRARGQGRQGPGRASSAAEAAAKAAKAVARAAAKAAAVDARRAAAEQLGGSTPAARILRSSTGPRVALFGAEALQVGPRAPETRLVCFGEVMATGLRWTANQLKKSDPAAAVGLLGSLAEPPEGQVDIGVTATVEVVRHHSKCSGDMERPAPGSRKKWKRPTCVRHPRQLLTKQKPASGLASLMCKGPETEALATSTDVRVTSAPPCLSARRVACTSGGNPRTARSGGT